MLDREMPVVGRAFDKDYYDTLKDAGERLRNAEFRKLDVLLVTTAEWELLNSLDREERLKTLKAALAYGYSSICVLSDRRTFKIERMIEELKEERK